MVYSQICTWLDDYVGSDPPEELLDTWDLMEWLKESDIISTFRDCYVKLLKNAHARNDALKILYALLWEYYLFRKDEAIINVETSKNTLLIEPTLNNSYSEYNILLASEFANIFNHERAPILRKKVETQFKAQWSQTVFLSKKTDLSVSARAFRYTPIVVDIYKIIRKCDIRMDLVGTHKMLPGLGGAADGIIIEEGTPSRMLITKAVLNINEHIIPYKYYCETQALLEVKDSAVPVDYCECIIEPGLSKEGEYVGTIVVIGDILNIASWTYGYSPVYPNNKTGRRLAMGFQATGTVIERQFWTCKKIHISPVIRNRRWWATIGLPVYRQFWEDVYRLRSDPAQVRPLFLDE